MDTTLLTRYFAGGRVGIGALLLLAPRLVLRGMLGGSEAVTPGVKLIGRMLGTRDALLGIGTLEALAGRGDVRPWLRYSALADASDAAAMVLAFGHLPKRKRAAMVLFALGGAATGAYLSTTE